MESSPFRLRSTARTTVGSGEPGGCKNQPQPDDAKPNPATAADRTRHLLVFINPPCACGAKQRPVYQYLPILNFLLLLIQTSNRRQIVNFLHQGLTLHRRRVASQHFLAGGVAVCFALAPTFIVFIIIAAGNQLPNQVEQNKDGQNQENGRTETGMVNDEVDQTERRRLQKV